MKKPIMTCFCLTLLVIFMASCGTPANPPLSKQDALTMTMTAMGAATAEMTHALLDEQPMGAMVDASSGTASSNLRAATTWNGTNVTVTINSYIVNQDLSGSADVTIVFSEYTASNGTVLNGTISLQYTFGPSIMSFSFDGNINIEYLGTTYSCIWKMSESWDGLKYSYSGYYKVDGYQYSFG
jgi:hypothetical protein